MDSSDFEVITSYTLGTNASSAQTSARAISAAFQWILPDDFAKSFSKVHDDDPYAQLRRKFWGNQDALQTYLPSPPTPLNKPEDSPATDGIPNTSAFADEDDILPGCGIIDVDISSFMDKLFVRADYMRLYDRLDQRRSEMARAGGIEVAPPVGILIGHPGVGKSTWMLYALLRRLVQCKPVVVFLGVQCLLLMEDAVYQFTDFTFIRHLRADVWILVDSEYAPNARALVHRSHIAFTIYSMYPDEARWSWISAISLPVVVTMDPWTRQEVHLTALARGLDLYDVDEAFDILGPLPRLCIAPQRPIHRSLHMQRIEWALNNRGLDQRGLVSNIFAPPGVLQISASDLILQVVSRSVHEDVESIPQLPFITLHISHRVLAEYESAIMDSSRTARNYRFYTRLSDAFAADALKLRAAISCFVRWGVTVQPTRKDTLTLFHDDSYKQFYFKAAHQPELGGPQIWSFHNTPRKIFPTTLYFQSSRSDQLLDAFIVSGGQLYIFYATKASEATLSLELLNFFDGIENIPQWDKWRIIFVIPRRPFSCHISEDERLNQMQFYTWLAATYAY